MAIHLKERTSIYSTWQKALDAIVLHNCLFPETAMKVIGFTRDSDGLMRIVLTQPYVNCLRLATKQEIDDMVTAKGFRDNWNGQGVNYISDRLALEDMHPAYQPDAYCPMVQRAVWIGTRTTKGTQTLIMV